MKNYICLALHASAIPALTIFQDYASGNLNPSIYLFSLDNGIIESLFIHLENTPWQPKALACMLLFAITLRWFFYSKSQKKHHSKAGKIESLIKEPSFQGKQQSISLQKDISEPEWERFEAMVFSSFPKLREALVSSKEVLPSVEVRISCLICIETDKNDICVLTGIDQDALTKHLSHLHQCFNLPLGQSVDDYIRIT